MTDDENTVAISELVEDQLRAQGCGCVRVGDGQVFVFTRAILEKLLAAAIEYGETNDDELAMLFVKSGPAA